MKHIISALVLVAAMTGVGRADLPSSTNLDDWIFGAVEPALANGVRGDGTTGDYINIPTGTSGFNYEVQTEGEGSVTFWIKDNGSSLENANLGYPSLGPMWGLGNAAYVNTAAGIGRPNYVAYDQGYSLWSSASEYTQYWFRDGLRASHSHPFTAGWYKWTADGTFTDITFTIHDVTYEILDGAPHTDDTFGDCSRVVNATTAAEDKWATAFGTGYNTFYLKGDGDGGPEDISVQVVSGTGVFAGGVSVSNEYTETNWNNVKQLFQN